MKKKERGRERGSKQQVPKGPGASPSHPSASSSSKHPLRRGSSSRRKGREHPNTLIKTLRGRETESDTSDEENQEESTRKRIRTDRLSANDRPSVPDTPSLDTGDHASFPYPFNSSHVGVGSTAAFPNSSLLSGGATEKRVELGAPIRPSSYFELALVEAASERSPRLEAAVVSKREGKDREIQKKGATKPRPKSVKPRSRSRNDIKERERRSRSTVGGAKKKKISATATKKKKKKRVVGKVQASTPSLPSSLLKARAKQAQNEDAHKPLPSYATATQSSIKKSRSLALPVPPIVNAGGSYAILHSELGTASPRGFRSQAERFEENGDDGVNDVVSDSGSDGRDMRERERENGRGRERERERGYENEALGKIATTVFYSQHGEEVPHLLHRAVSADAFDGDAELSSSSSPLSTFSLSPAGTGSPPEDREKEREKKRYVQPRIERLSVQENVRQQYPIPTVYVASRDGRPVGGAGEKEKIRVSTGKTTKTLSISRLEQQLQWRSPNSKGKAGQKKKVERERDGKERDGGRVRYRVDRPTKSSIQKKANRGPVPAPRPSSLSRPPVPHSSPPSRPSRVKDDDAEIVQLLSKLSVSFPTISKEVKALMATYKVNGK